MVCSRCGTQNDALAKACSNCGGALQSSGTGPVIAAQPPVIIIQNAKSSGLAAVLSFFWCGLGQIYNGQIGKGIAMGVLYLISLFLIALVIGFITTPILWIWGMVDAYKTAERINRDTRAV